MANATEPNREKHYAPKHSAGRCGTPAKQHTHTLTHKKKRRIISIMVCANSMLYNLVGKCPCLHTQTLPRLRARFGCGLAALALSLTRSGLPLLVSLCVCVCGSISRQPNNTSTSVHANHSLASRRLRLNAGVRVRRAESSFPKLV